jgi:hypothetical protein
MQRPCHNIHLVLLQVHVFVGHLECRKNAPDFQAENRLRHLGRIRVQGCHLPDIRPDTGERKKVDTQADSSPQYPVTDTSFDFAEYLRSTKKILKIR